MLVFFKELDLSEGELLVFLRFKTSCVRMVHYQLVLKQMMNAHIFL